MVPQLQHDEELEDEYAGQEQDEEARAGRRHGGAVLTRRHAAFESRSSYFSVVTSHIFVVRSHFNVS